MFLHYSVVKSTFLILPAGHDILHPARQVRARVLPPRVPPQHHPLHVLDRRGVHGRRRLRPGRHHQLLHPRPHVRLLLPGRAGTSHAKVPVVEEVPHEAAGMRE